MYGVEQYYKWIEIAEQKRTASAVLKKMGLHKQAIRALRDSIRAERMAEFYKETGKIQKSN